MRRKKNKDIYFDGAANTPVDSRVFKAMKPYLDGTLWGNSHGIHSYGRDSLTAVEKSREDIAEVLSVSSTEIYFTSGATESNNWVLTSIIYRIKEMTGRNRIVVSKIEHSSIISACKRLEQVGFEVCYVPYKSNKKDQLDAFSYFINDNTALVICMSVNNETGEVNKINLIGRLAHEHKAYMLSDMTQYFSLGGETSLAQFNYVDYFSFSAHKIYGPTGVGCLIARDRAPIAPLIIGGSQEQGMRSGTHNVAGIVGCAEALKLCQKEDNRKHYLHLQAVLLWGIKELNHKYDTHIQLNYSSPLYQHYNIASINLSSIKFFDDAASYLSNYGIACSAGAACNVENDGPHPSHVLLEMGVPEDQISSCVRISFIKTSTEEEVQKFLKVLEEIIIDTRSAQND